MRMTERAHQAVRKVVRAGEEVIDATAGNGHDTVFMANLVGSKGRVFAFDIQETAMDATRSNLEAAGIPHDRVLLIRDSHANMRRYVSSPVAAVMFNLGYCPGGDHAIRTRYDETRAALGRAWELLRAKGVLTIVCYRGHPGGQKEGTTVLEAARMLKTQGAAIDIFGVNETVTGPFLVVVRKGGEPCC